MIQKSISQKSNQAISILSHKNQDNETFFLVKWSDQKQTWESSNKCSSLKVLIKKYFADNNHIDISKVIKGDKNKSLKFLQQKQQNWQKVHKSKQKKQKKKIEDDGIKAVDTDVIRRLSQVIKKLQHKLNKKKQNNRMKHIIDYQIHSIEGICKNNKNQFYCVVRPMKIRDKYCVSMKNMKKHFPKSLIVYLKEIIMMHQNPKDILRPLGSEYNSQSQQSNFNDQNISDNYKGKLFSLPHNQSSLYYGDQDLSLQDQDNGNGFDKMNKRLGDQDPFEYVEQNEQNSEILIEE